MIDFNKLTAECGAFGVTPDKLALERLDRYAQLLVEWNQKMNLTAITEPDAIVTRHFADSAKFPQYKLIFTTFDNAENGYLLEGNLLTENVSGATRSVILTDTQLEELKTLLGL